MQFDPNKIHSTKLNDKAFEDLYISARTNELRVLNDERVRQLPSFVGDRKLVREWKIREKTCKKFFSYSHISIQDVLDLGCGNGWFSNLISKKLNPKRVFAVDVNRIELEQGFRIFKSEKIGFYYSDIFDKEWDENRFDLIVMNASIQYFEDLSPLIDRLLLLLTPGGQIHILDSPFYHMEDITQAKIRSKAYYESIGKADLIKYYHHHSCEEIDRYRPEYLYRPKKFWMKIQSLLGFSTSPFPWFLIKQND